MPERQKLERYQLDSEYRDTTTDPERSLLAAILARAILDATGNLQIGGEKSNGHKWESKRWIAKNTNRPFTFIWICHSLNLEPQKIRHFIEQNKTPLLRSYRVKRYKETPHENRNLINF